MGSYAQWGLFGVSVLATASADVTGSENEFILFLGTAMVTAVWIMVRGVTQRILCARAVYEMGYRAGRRDANAALTEVGAALMGTLDDEDYN